MDPLEKWIRDQQQKVAYFDSKQNPSTSSIEKQKQNAHKAGYLEALNNMSLLIQTLKQAHRY